MPAGTHGGLTQRARNGEPQPLPMQMIPGESNSSKRDLKSWWKTFSKGNQKREDDKAVPQQGIFGIPLQTSVRYANVAISLQDAEGKSYVYGYVPIVVAKCGVFLKEKATDIEGIFRLSGSEKRIKELKEIFNSPDRYGKGLDWTGYTVHDAANILRRYFNQLPEPIIPLDFYERFRDPLRGHQSQAVGQIDGQSPSEGEFNHKVTIRVYQSLITELPPLNRQLLLYILDLLAVFASKSDLNKMTTPNLAAIFQPGILSHPAHDMAPPEYRLSQDVLIFLIENQDHFLIGMAGTGADEKTKQDVESGPPTPSVQRTPKLIGRSSSGASKYSGVRRSVSVSSKKSSVAPSPISPSPHTPTGGGVGVHRSNTVPSKHSPRTSHSRFQREHTAETPSPVATPMYTPMEMPGTFPDIGEPAAEASRTPATVPAVPGIISPSPPHETAPAPSVQPVSHESMDETPSSDNMQARPDNIDIPPQPRNFSFAPGQDNVTPSSGGNRLAAIFGSKPSTPGSEGSRKPKKLQKKRLPGSLNPSAHSSQYSLSDAPNPHEQMPMEAPMTSAPFVPGAPVHTSSLPTPGPAVATPTNPTFLHPPSSVENTPLKPPSSAGLKADPPMSPAHSYRSHSEFTEGELDDVQPLDHQGPDITSDRETSEQAESGGKRSRFWRRKGDSVSYSHSPSPNFEAQRSRSSVLSGGDGTRKSFTLDRGSSDPESIDPQRENNPLIWIKEKLDKYADRNAEKQMEKERRREEKRRNKSPTGSDFGHHRGISHNIHSLGASGAESMPRGKSMDIKRDTGPSMDVSREQPVLRPPEERTGAAVQAASIPTVTPPTPIPTEPTVAEVDFASRRTPAEAAPTETSTAPLATENNPSSIVESAKGGEAMAQKSLPANTDEEASNSKSEPPIATSPRTAEHAVNPATGN